VRENAFDIVVALRESGAIDAGKAIACIATNDGETARLS
jgi:hypothetical protein